jgi:hypothetical protein
MNIKVAQNNTEPQALLIAPRGPLIAANSNKETIERVSSQAESVDPGPFAGKLVGQQYSLLYLIGFVLALALIAQLVVLPPQVEDGLRYVAVLLAQ